VTEGVGAAVVDGLGGHPPIVKETLLSLLRVSLFGGLAVEFRQVDGHRRAAASEVPSVSQALCCQRVAGWMALLPRSCRGDNPILW